MESLADLTSPARVALAREITLAARKDPELRERLDAALAAQGFEAMTTGALIEMASEYRVAPARVDEITKTCSAEMRRVETRYFCRECLDERLVGNDDDGWLPCPNCNIVPTDVVFDPASC